MTEACEVQIEFVPAEGDATVLKKGIKLQAGEVLDATFMSCKELCAFYEKEIADAKAKDILLSLHLKATMMKVSDPMIFGYCVKTFFKDVFEKYADHFAELGVNANNGFGDVADKIAKSPKKAEIE